MTCAAKGLKDEDLLSVDIVSLEPIVQVVEFVCSTITEGVAVYPATAVHWYFVLIKAKIFEDDSGTSAASRYVQVAHNWC